MQSLVEQLVPNNRGFAGAAGDDDDPLARAIEDLLLGIVDAATPSQKDSHSMYPPHEDRSDHVEKPVESQTAPLMRLLNNPVLGRASVSTIPSNTTNGLDPRAAEDSGAPHERQNKHEDAVRDLCSTLPPQSEMSALFDDKSSWWPLWRESLGLVWGGTDSTTLRMFAAQALTDGHPCLLGILLVALAISTGDLRTYLLPVERRILNDDELAGTEHGLSCLMALGLCYMNALQPRRAWTVYRRANTLLQLNGIHLTANRQSRSQSSGSSSTLIVGYRS